MPGGLEARRQQASGSCPKQTADQATTGGGGEGAASLPGRFLQQLAGNILGQGITAN
jgi:hypothetical protein